MEIMSGNYFYLAAGLASAAVLVGWQVKQRMDMYKKDPISSLPLPPGSFGWPILGETIAMLRSGFDPKPWHKAYGPICKTSMLMRDKCAWIMDPELSQEFFKKHRGPLERPSTPFGDRFLKGSLLQLAGQEHHEQRRMLLPAFSPKNLRRYVLRTQTLVQSHLDRWATKDKFDAQQAITNMTFEVSAAFFLGASREMTGHIKMLFEEFMKGSFVLVLRDWPCTQFRKTKRAHEELVAFIKDVIAQRRATAKDFDDDSGEAAADPLGLMLNQKDDDGNVLPLETIVSTSLLMLLAGYDTTKSSLIAILFKLMEYPEIQKRLREEIFETLGEGNEPFTLDQLNSMEYLDKFLREVFRVMPVFLFHADRRTTQTVEIGGFQIPKGWYVTGQRHVFDNSASVFESPAEFDPDREDSVMTVPSSGAKMRNMSIYGYGQYECLGKHFAQLERKVFTVMLLRQFTPKLLTEGFPKVSYKTSFMTVDPEFSVRLQPLIA